MYRLSVHEDAKKDLDDLWQSDEDTAADIAVFLDEAEKDQDLLDRFTQHGYSTEASGSWITDVDVSRWQHLWHTGIGVWRLKLWVLERDHLKFRIIYCFHPKNRHYHVVAILHRSGTDYDNASSERTSRIRAVCRELLDA